MRKAKGDKSTKVGGRRKAGPAATKRSVAKMMKGRPVLAPEGRESRTNDGRPA
jgi:hypothetical protein